MENERDSTTQLATSSPSEDIFTDNSVENHDLSSQLLPVDNEENKNLDENNPQEEITAVDSDNLPPPPLAAKNEPTDPIHSPHVPEVNAFSEPTNEELVVPQNETFNVVPSDADSEAVESPQSELVAVITAEDYSNEEKTEDSNQTRRSAEYGDETSANEMQEDTEPSLINDDDKNDFSKHGEEETKGGDGTRRSAEYGDETSANEMQEGPTDTEPSLISDGDKTDFSKHQDSAEIPDETEKSLPSNTEVSLPFIPSTENADIDVKDPSQDIESSTEASTPKTITNEQLDIEPELQHGPSVPADEEPLQSKLNASVSHEDVVVEMEPLAAKSGTNTAQSFSDDSNKDQDNEKLAQDQVEKPPGYKHQSSAEDSMLITVEEASEEVREEDVGNSEDTAQNKSQDIENLPREELEKLLRSTMKKRRQWIFVATLLAVACWVLACTTAVYAFNFNSLRDACGDPNS